MRRAAMPLGRSIRFAALALLALGCHARSPTPVRDGATASAPAAEPKAVTRATLANGLRVVLVRNALAPVVTTQMNYLAGSNEGPAGFPGTAHALEHMMFRGSPELTGDQLANIVAAMGGNFNAETGQTATSYYFTVPARDLEVALRIEAIRMRGVRNLPEAWDAERKAIEQEVAQALSSPEYLMQSQLLEAVFKGTPYQFDALGTRPSFQKTTAAMLQQFHRAWYAPNNAVLVVVGDLEPQAAMATIERLFGSIDRRSLPPRADVALQPVEAKRIALESDLPVGLAVIAFRLPGFDSADFAAAEVLEHALSSQRGALYPLVLEGDAGDVGFVISGLPRASLAYAAATFNDPAEGEAVVAKLGRALAVAVERGIPAELVEAAKHQQLTLAELEKNSIPGLARAWSEAIAVEGRSSPDDETAAIQRVTADEVNRVARTYLDPRRGVTAILTPKPSGEAVPSAGVGHGESFAPTATKPVPLPSWAEGLVEKLSVPEQTVQPMETVLPNGLRVLVQPVSISGTVNVFGAVKTRAEVQAPPGKEGVDELLEALFAFGTTNLDRVAFQKALDDIGAIETAGESFSVQVLAEHFERGVQLLADNLLNPALPEEDFTVQREQLAQATAGLLESADYRTSRALEAALFPRGDPTLREATPQTVAGLSPADLREYHRKVYRPDMTTIVVLGKVDPARATEVIARYFGGWKAEGPKPSTLLPRVPPNTSATVRVPDASRVQDNVYLGLALGLDRFDPDYYALELGNTVLGGAFYATRLYRELREKQGLVYFVSSTLQVGETRGVYLVNFGSDPPEVGRARAIVQRLLQDVRTTPVSPEELERARAQLVREIPLSESSVQDIAAGWLERSRIGLPLDEPVRAARQYLAMDAAKVRAAYERWIRPDDFAVVVSGPPKR